MLFVLSPAKSLDYETPASMDLSHTLPQFARQSAELIDLLKSKTTMEIAELMDLSENLAALNAARYQAYRARFTAKNSKQAILAFNGDVYEGLQAQTLQSTDLDWAQTHLVMLSGLYGALRPLDRIQPYRLEMGTALANAKGGNLYRFWGSSLAHYLDQQLRGDALPIVVNLASQEYFKAVDRKALKARVVECVFEEFKSGQYKVISFMAKRARGLMARFAIERRISELEDLKRFSSENYRFHAASSDENRFVFRRKK